MNIFLQKKFLFAFLISAFFLLLPTANFAQIIGWDANNTGGGFGTSPWTPATLNANLQTSGLVRGSSIATSGTPAGSCWGGSGGWSTSQSDANSFYFTFQAATGYKASLSSISTATRRSNSGPAGCIVYYSVGGDPFTSVASWTTSSTSGTTGTSNTVSLSGIPALQNIAAGVVVKFRIIPQGSTGNYYLTGGTNSLKIDGSVVVAASPLITPSTTSLASFGDVMVGNSSTSQSFTFDGSALTGDVSIAAPAGFEISTDNINWYPGTDISPVAGSLDDIQVWVRFSPTTTGTATGNIVLSSAGATDKIVSVTGNGLPAIAIVVDDEPYGPYCNGIDNTFDLDFTPAGSFVSPDFYAQLSNPDGTFPSTPTNIVGFSATSPISVTIPANTAASPNYRVRVYNNDPLIFSSNDNGHDIVVNPAATLSGITQANVACDGSEITINMAGLLPSTTSSITYAINGGASQNLTGITSDASGNASFPVILSEENNGQSLTISSIERTDISSCPHTLTANNSVVLSVLPSPTVTAVNSTSLCGDSGTTTISLTGLIPNTTSTISYSIAGGTSTTLNGLVSNTAGEVTFDLPLLSENNGQTLEITSITRTDISPNCNSLLTGISTSLSINERPTATVTGDQAVCFGSTSDISVALTGTAPWNIIYTDGSGSFTINNIAASPYVFTVGTFSTKTYTVTALEDANCTANLSGITGSATVTVNPVSNGGNILGSTPVCTGTNSGTLTLENHVGNVVKWQSSPTIDFSTATDITNTTATLEYANLLETTYYRAVVSNSPCGAVNSTTAVITINETQAPITQSQTFCNSGTVADLFPNTSGIQWYSLPTGGTALLPTEALATGDYYATMTIDGCESTRTLTTVTVNQTPAPTTVSQTFCNSGTVADLLPNATGIQWYSLPTGGTALLPTEALATGNYYATMTIDGCESTRTLTTVTVNQTPAPTTVSQTFCNSGTVADLLPNTTGIQWYSLPTGGTVLLLTEALATGDYYATMTIDGCESTRTLTSIIINAPLAPSGDADQEFTDGETLEDIEITGTNVEWYSSEEAAEVGTAPLDMDELLTDGTTYYAVEIANGCRSNAFAVTVSMALKTPEFSIENLKVYPNPFTDTITISYSENIDSVEVYNLLGQKLIEKTVNNNDIKLDMSSLNSGTYLLKVYYGKATKTSKIIKR